MTELPFNGPRPVPPAERLLPTTVAEPWFKATDEPGLLESPCFDRAGNLLFVEVYSGRIFSLSKEQRLRTLLDQNNYGSAGLAIHKDGRIFVAGLGNFADTGLVYAIRPDGTDFNEIVPPGGGYLVDDLVFDAAGGFYFTDLRGTPSSPTGGVYYTTPDFKHTQVVIANLAAANGVALTPDGKELWATEYGCGRLHRVGLTDAVTPTFARSFITYYFTGASCDSMRTDASGNMYVAIHDQGRILVFGSHGLPVAQILISGREDGRFLDTTSMAIKPGTNDLYIVSSDPEAGGTIFRAKALGSAAKLYSHS